ncbi:MAG: alpha/beta hydrolase, partial [Gammaproteobacteria bacterium]
KSLAKPIVGGDRTAAAEGNTVALSRDVEAGALNVLPRCATPGNAKWIPKNIPTLIFAGDEDHITPLSLFATANEFQRDNIVMREVAHAGHYPWIENPDQIKMLFEDYCQRLKILSTPSLP